VKLLEHGVVALGLDHGGHEGVVLGGGAYEGRPADVDVVDHLGLAGATAVRGPLERIQVHAHEVDRLDPVRVEDRRVLGVGAHGEEPGVDPRVQGLHATFEHLGEPGQVLDRAGLDARVGQLASRAPGRDELDPEVCEATGEVDEPALVGDAKEGAADAYLGGRVQRRSAGAGVEIGRSGL
jgi:hypothetical protein